MHTFLEITVSWSLSYFLGKTYQQCKNKYTYLQNPDIKARGEADKYDNMRIESGKSYSDMVKIGDAYGSI